MGVLPARLANQELKLIEAGAADQIEHKPSAIVKETHCAARDPPQPASRTQIFPQTSVHGNLAPTQPCKQFSPASHGNGAKST